MLKFRAHKGFNRAIRIQMSSNVHKRVQLGSNMSPTVVKNWAEKGSTKLKFGIKRVQKGSIMDSTGIKFGLKGVQIGSKSNSNELKVRLKRVQWGSNSGSNGFKWAQKGYKFRIG